jgi:hypothetical protein
MIVAMLHAFSNGPGRRVLIAPPGPDCTIFDIGKGLVSYFVCALRGGVNACRMATAIGKF